MIAALASLKYFACLTHSVKKIIFRSESGAVVWVKQNKTSQNEALGLFTSMITQVWVPYFRFYFCSKELFNWSFSGCLLSCTNWLFYATKMGYLIRLKRSQFGSQSKVQFKKRISAFTLAPFHWKTRCLLHSLWCSLFFHY